MRVMVGRNGAIVIVLIRIPITPELVIVRPVAAELRPDIADRISVYSPAGIERIACVVLLAAI